MTKIAATLLSMLLLAASAYAQAADGDNEVKSLRGLRGVRVLVERIRPELKKDGLTEDQLQTDTEIRLRKAGIPVLTEAAWLNSPGKPFLYIEVKAFSPVDGSYFFLEAVQLEQEVSLLRPAPQHRRSVVATTWKDRGLGTIGAKDARTIRDHVADSVDKFINGYLIANHK